ncbi:hypothetical protein FHG87_024133, partial [Trinorchestia longiramus]
MRDGALHLHDTGFESNLGPVVTAISKNKSITTLSLGRNLNTIKSKHVGQVVESLVFLLQEDDCSLEVLSINDSRFKSEIHNLLNALAGNTSLRTLDISSVDCAQFSGLCPVQWTGQFSGLPSSVDWPVQCAVCYSGNCMGDSGARLLAKALQINTRLQHITIDRNSVSLQGFTDLAYALQHNYSVKFMPFPLHDVSSCMKTAPERTDAVMKRIQDALQRNVQPTRHSSHAQALRLHQ